MSRGNKNILFSKIFLNFVNMMKLMDEFDSRGNRNILFSKVFFSFLSMR